MELFIPLI